MPGEAKTRKQAKYHIVPAQLWYCTKRLPVHVASEDPLQDFGHLLISPDLEHRLIQSCALPREPALLYCLLLPQYLCSCRFREEEPRRPILQECHLHPELPRMETALAMGIATTILPPQARRGPPRKAPFHASHVAGAKSSAEANSLSVAVVWHETMRVSISCKFSQSTDPLFS